MSATTRSAPVPFTSFSCKAAAARPEATSPARAPPIPSAIANSGGSQTYASSFKRRFRPGCVATALRATLKTRTAPEALSAGCSASLDAPRKARLGRADTPLDRSRSPSWQPPHGHARKARLSGLVARNAKHFERSERGARRDSSFVPEIRFAHANDVPRGELLRAREAGAVEIRAVGRADVLDPDAVAARLDSRVPAGRELVVVETDVVRGRPADGDRLRVQLEARAPLERVRADGDERAGVDRLRLASESGRGRLLRAHDEALLRHAHVARRAANNAPDEEVEQHEKADLEDEQSGLDLDGREHQATSRRNAISVEPIVILSPFCSFARLVRMPFTSRPFVESRSTTQYAVPSWRTSAWRRDALASSIWISQSRERPSVVRCLVTSWLVPSTLNVTTSRVTPSSSGVAAAVGCCAGR